MWQIKAIVGVVALGALLGADWMQASRHLPAGHAMSFTEYLAGLGQRAGQLAGTGTAEPSAALAAALPPPPTGWTRRETAKGDVTALLVPAAQAVVGGGGGAPGADVRSLAAVGRGPWPEGTSVAAFTYRYGKDVVVVELLRHPDALFHGTARMPERMALQTWVMDNGAERLGTVKGMPVWRARLSPGLGAGMAIAAVGGQVQLRAVFAERVKPAALMAILQGLDVAALNRGVVAPDAAITAATTPSAPDAATGAGIVGAVTGMLFGTTAKDGTESERKAPEAEQVAAAQPGDAAPAARASGALAEQPGARGRRQAAIDIGVGSCGDRGAARFCSVGGAKDARSSD